MTSEPRDPGGPGDRADGAAPREGAVVVVVATAAALTLIGHPIGLGVSVAAIAIYGVAAVRRRNAWWVLAAALASVATVRAAAWVVAPALVTSLGVASYAAAGGTSWRQVVLGVVRVGAIPDAGAAVVRRLPWRLETPALRGGLIAVVVLAVFVPLFASADAAFAHILDTLVPQESADRPVSRTLLWLGLVTLGGALLRVGTARAGRPATTRLATVEWALPLGLLVALFAAFVAVQITTLFGGNEYVLKTANLTYAEYARSGFAQLMIAAALTLAMIAAAARYAPRTRGRDALCGALAVLTLVILASAYKRLHLYEDVWGFTRLRLSADAAILWLGGLFALLLIARRGLPRVTLALTAASVLAFALSNPDGRIAEHNIDRFERTGRIDRFALRDLSVDAAPALRRFGERVDCPDRDPLVSFNVARAACR